MSESKERERERSVCVQPDAALCFSTCSNMPDVIHYACKKKHI